MGPLILAFKNLRDHRERVPKSLWKYFDEHIMVSGWYPEKDFFVLLEAFVATIDPAQVGGDAWHFLGGVSARRDIGGSQVRIAMENRVESPGLYRNYARVDAKDVGQFIKRAIKLWGQYHDTGKMEIRGGRVTTNSFVVRLVGFQIPVDGYVRLQTGYMEEYGHLVGIPLTGKVLRNSAKGDPFCEWEYTLERSEASEAFIQSLTPLR